MGSIASGIRYIVGLAMVTAGVSMAVPFGRLVADGWNRTPGAADASAIAAPVVAGPMAAPAANVSTPWMVPDDMQPGPVVVRGDYVPPPAPDMLPPVNPALTASSPAMNGMYRSTLEVPPPPLLDAQAPPPPVAAWAAPESPRMPAPSTGIAADLVPATYSVRDGDDLTSISTRFYGHPGAAAAVWQANRDVIPDPNLLPIGAELRLPPSWSVAGPQRTVVGGGRSIEPPAGPPAPRMMSPATGAAGGPPVWLGTHAVPQAGVAITSPPVSGGTVRLAAGETLESLAVRFYGDRNAAQRIWEANRDRLRSPDLAVAGMELRLP
ncbi:MAG: LysM peptidoglycan-binding domain-containing protein [Planctomycetia bacterium]|nr:LysM peptidoglycan-binding domain-containing protein [Planctomycetia bacterium]